MNPTIRNEVAQLVEDTFSTLEAKFGRTFPRPPVRFDLRGRTAGKASRNAEYIRFNVDLLSDPR